MNWMELVASVIGSLAWPVGVVVAALLLAPKLRDLLPLVKRGKVGPSGIEWELFDEGRELSTALEDEADELADKLEPPDMAAEGPEPSARKPRAPKRSSNVAADESPAEADSPPHKSREALILERLEGALPADLLDRTKSVESEEFARVAEVSPTAAVLRRHAELERTIRDVVRQARVELGAEPRPWQHVGRELGLLTEDDDRALRWLRKVRNELAHGDLEVNTALAYDFALLADQVERNVLVRTILLFQDSRRKQ